MKKLTTKRVMLTSLALGATLAASSPALAEEKPPPTEVTRPNQTLLIGGSVLLVGGYAPSLVIAASSDHDGDKWLYVPIAGPWADLAGRGGCGNNSCGTEAAYKLLLIGTGIAQVAGAAGIVASFFVPQSQATTTTMTGKKKEDPIPRPTIAPARMGKDGYGLLLSGNF